MGSTTSYNIKTRGLYIYKHGSLAKIQVLSLFPLTRPISTGHAPFTPRHFAHRPRTIESAPPEPDPLGICPLPHLILFVVLGGGGGGGGGENHGASIGFI